MGEISLLTLQIIAWSKVIFFIFFILLIYFIFARKKPEYFLVLISVSLISFYLVLLYPLQKMFWGNNGDEVFIFAFLKNVIAGHYFTDYFYNWLPPFYPPLYFWITGSLARLFTTSGIVAAKIGILGSITIWFLGSFYWQKLFWQKIKEKAKNNVINIKWFWLISPVIYLFFLDSAVIMFKPYEIVSAFFACLLIGLLIYNISDKVWTIKNYLFFGINIGLLFLLYHFWWFILIPTILVLVLIFREKQTYLKRIIICGFIGLLLTLPYLIPLIISFIKYGTENWQVAYFVPQFFSSFIPWFGLSIKSFIAILGLIGFILFFRRKFIIANLTIFIFCYLYQFLNIIIFLLVGKSFLADKPFLFLAGASLCLSASYLIIYYYQKLSINYASVIQKITILIIVVLLLPQMPFAKFIDDPEMIKQIENDLEITGAKGLADYLIANIPDYQNRIWLVSGYPELNAYLTIYYYIAYNPHFSHPAVIYSERLKVVKEISNIHTPIDFMNLIDSSSLKEINGLIFYNDENSSYYPLFFWQDNYPNGGKEMIIRINKSIISGDYWHEYYFGNWVIFVKK